MRIKKRMENDWYLEENSMKKCWNCGKETNKLSLSFNAPICSEVCEIEMSNEYDKEYYDD